MNTSYVSLLPIIIINFYVHGVCQECRKHWSNDNSCKPLIEYLIISLNQNLHIIGSRYTFCYRWVRNHHSRNVFTAYTLHGTSNHGTTGYTTNWCLWYYAWCIRRASTAEIILYYIAKLIIMLWHMLYPVWSASKQHDPSVSRSGAPKLNIPMVFICTMHLCMVVL